jgi:nucleoside-diphosphate-sugar epimerase
MKMSKRKKSSLLITGGLGFIGAHVARRLLSKFEIVILDWDKSKLGSMLARDFKSSGIIVHQMDVADARTWKELGPCRYIFHAAAQPAAIESERDPQRDLLTNTLGTQLLAEYARAHQSSIIFCNTIRIYDSAAVDRIYKQNGSVPETCQTIIETKNWSPPFAYSKYAAECILKWYSEKYKLPVISHRMSGIVGAGQRSSQIHGWVSYLIKCAASGKKFTIFGDGKQTRDILHIDDYVDLIEMELSDFSYFSNNKFIVYNIGGGGRNEISINDLITLIMKEHNLFLKRDYDEFRGGEPKHYVTALSKISKKSWVPKYTDPKKIISDLVRQFGGG